MSAVAGILDVLLNTPDITVMTEQRIWGMEIPRFCSEHGDCREGQHMPRACIVVTRDGGGAGGPGARSYARWRNDRLDIFTFGKDPLEAERLQVLVYDRMTDLRQTHVMSANVILKNAVVSGGPLPGRDPDGDWPYQFMSFDVASTPDS